MPRRVFRLSCPNCLANGRPLLLCRASLSQIRNSVRIDAMAFLSRQNGPCSSGHLCFGTERNIDNSPRFTTLNGCRVLFGIRVRISGYPPARPCAHLQVSPESTFRIRQDSLPKFGLDARGSKIDLAIPVLDNTAHHTPTPTPTACPPSAPTSNEFARSFCH